MCLIANKLTPFLITILPKKVYKIVAIKGDELYTAVMLYPISGNTLTADSPIEKYYSGNTKRIEGGMIHSCMNKDDAFGFIYYWNNNDSEYRYQVYEAIIPPFTRYIKGYCDMIASKKIKLIK